MTKLHGRCLCGQIGFEINGPISACVTCHCESCRRQCSAPMTTYIGVADGHWRWTSGTPKVFRSSPDVERSFCDVSGTPLSFRSQAMSDTMHLYLAALNDPEALHPSLHVAFEEKLAWVELADDLPTCVGPDYTKAAPKVRGR